MTGLQVEPDVAWRGHPGYGTAHLGGCWRALRHGGVVGLGGTKHQRDRQPSASSRPDGHVGYRAAGTDLDGLARNLARWLPGSG
jgi:hypothetical protein